MEPDKSSAQCTIDNCTTVLECTTNGNLKRHIMLMHKELSATHGWNSTDDDSQTQKVIVRTNKRIIVESLVNLIAVDYHPYNILNQQSFQDLVKPLCDALNINFSVYSIQEKVKERAEEYRQKIRAEIKNKFISLKIDSATRYNRNVLGINLQYLEKGEIEIRTLSMLEVKEAQTAAFLKDEVLRVLQVYGIELKYVISITTDNAANMLLAAKFLDQEVTGDDTTHPEMLEFIDETIMFEEQNWTIFSIKCAAHLLQLCINDVLKQIPYCNDLSEMRKLVNLLKKKPYRHEFQKDKKALPVKDAPTRWSSTYLMTKSILENKDFILHIFAKYNDRNSITILNRLLPVIKDMTEVLRPFAEAVTFLQGEQLVIGDLFRTILELDMELEEINDGNTLKPLMIENLKNRKEKIFESDAVLSAIFLDPRFNYQGSTFLSVTEKIRAKGYLKKLHHCIERNEILSNANASETLPSTAIRNDDHPVSSDSSRLKRLELKYSTHNRMTGNQSSIEVALNAVCNDDKLDFDKSVLKYYDCFEGNKCLIPLVNAVMGIPATQVTVERAFSALALFLTPHRTCLTAEHLDDLMVVNCNKKFNKKM